MKISLIDYLSGEQVGNFGYFECFGYFGYF